MSAISADLIIKGGTLVCLDEGMQVLDDHALIIKDGLIHAIVPIETSTSYEAPILDACGCLIIPGLINTHTHMAMTYFRGLADDLPLNIWLNKYIWPLEANLVNPEMVYHATLHAAAEMLLGGIVMANDMYFCGRDSALACIDAGMRAIIGEAIINPKHASDIAAIGTLQMQLKQEFSSEKLLDFSLAPHAIYTCNKEVLERCATVAKDNDLLLHIHLSETKFEVDYSHKTYGCKPVEAVEKLGLLGRKTILAHGIWVDEDEMEILAKHGVSIASCLESNLKLCSGILPMQKYLQHGINIALATDGVASNNNLDLFSEMDFNAKLHKSMANDPAFLPASDILKMCTINAAKALGLDSVTGSLQVGKWADISILNTASLPATPIYSPYSHIVYALGADAVRDVIVAGKLRVKNRELLQVDKAEILSQAAHYQKIVREISSL